MMDKRIKELASKIVDMFEDQDTGGCVFSGDCKRDSDGICTDCSNEWVEAQIKQFMNEPCSTRKEKDTEHIKRTPSEYEIARRLVITNQRCTIGLLQMYIPLTMKRAQELIWDLESQGIVGPSRGGYSREVLTIDRDWL